MIHVLLARCVIGGLLGFMVSIFFCILGNADLKWWLIVSFVGVSMGVILGYGTYKIPKTEEEQPLTEVDEL